MKMKEEEEQMEWEEEEEEEEEEDGDEDEVENCSIALFFYASLRPPQVFIKDRSLLLFVPFRNSCFWI